MTCEDKRYNNQGNRALVDFLTNRTLLDAGCGTGAFMIGAASQGYEGLGLSWDARNQHVAQVRTEQEFQRLASRCWNQPSNLGACACVRPRGPFRSGVSRAYACGRLIVEAILARMLAEGAEGAPSTAIVRTDSNTQWDQQLQDLYEEVGYQLTTQFVCEQ